MKKILFLLIICNVCKAQVYNSYEDYDNHNTQYKGKIKQVENNYYINYSYDSGKLKKNDTTLNAGFKLQDSRKESFYISGKIQKLKFGTVDTSKFWTREFSYDSSNNLVAIFERDYKNLETGHSIFNYKCGRIESVDNYSKKKFVSETVYFYNKKDVLKKTETTSFRSKSLYKEKFVDDKTIENITYYAKRITSKSFTIQDDTSILYISFPNLDKNNSYANTSEIRICKDKDLHLTYLCKMKDNKGVFIADNITVETQYDDHKNLTKLVTYDNLNKTYYTYTIEYKYDTYGNIIERLKTDENGNKYLKKSMFEYY